MTKERVGQYSIRINDQYRRCFAGRTARVNEFETPPLEFTEYLAVTERCVRGGSHTAVRQLEQAMFAYLDQRNRNAKPFVWKANADLILGKVERLCQRISNSGH